MNHERDATAAAIGTADIVEIEELLGRYADVCDTRAWHRFAEIFTEDAEVDFSAFGGGVVSGRENLEETFRNLPNAAAHVLGVGFLTESGGEVRIQAKLATPGASDRLSTCDLTDVVVRSPDGWRVRRRTYSVRPRS